MKKTNNDETVHEDMENQLALRRGFMLTCAYSQKMIQPVGKPPEVQD